MKRYLILAVLMIALLSAAALAARAEEDFDAWLQAQYEGWKTESVSRWGDAGAAVLSRGEEGMLVVKRGDAVLKNPGAVNVSRPNNYSVHMDTDSSLFFTCQSSTDQRRETFVFLYEQGQWRLSGAVFLEEDEKETPDSQNGVTAVLWDYSTLLQDGWVLRTVCLEDENENLLWSNELPPLPDVLTAEEKDLAHFSHKDTVLHAWGYGEKYNAASDEVCCRVFDALKADTPYGAYACVDGLIGNDTLQLVADRPDGSRVLLCAGWEEGLGWQFVESTPLPAETIMGFENMVSCLGLGGERRGPSIQRFSDGSWGVYMMAGQTQIFMGQNWVSENGCLWWDEGTYVGDHPWSDITGMDWESLPNSVEEALARLDSRRWATPNSPSPRDRLNLRERPERSSGSLGKYYNGTPVQVLEKGKEWTKVRIGPQEGYMMTKYLAFDEEMRRVAPQSDAQLSRNVLTRVHWQVGQSARTGGLPQPTLPALMFIGLADGDWYLIWDFNANRFGRIHADELWGGNG